MKKDSKSKKLVIILFGPPGAGKGTQAELLSEKLRLYYVETSKIIEDTVIDAKKDDFITIKEDKIVMGKQKEKKYFLITQQRYWKEGFLCSPPFVLYLLKKKIKELTQAKRNLVLAGSPRTTYESKRVIPLLKKAYGISNIKVILLKLSAKESIFRNSHRRICELIRHPILYNKETTKLTKCPLDGSKLIKRKKLDDPETIKIRLKEYEERTLPLIDHFKEEGLQVKEVNGEQSVADVFKDILKAINN